MKTNSNSIPDRIDQQPCSTNDMLRKKKKPPSHRQVNKINKLRAEGEKFISDRTSTTKGFKKFSR